MTSKEKTLETIIEQNQDKINENLSEIAKTTAIALNNEVFIEVVNEELQKKSIDNDYVVTFQIINEALQKKGYTFSTILMNANINLGNGGIINNLLSNIIYGFKLDNVEFTPTIFAPQLDTETFNQIIWIQNNTPVFIIPIHQKQENMFYGYNKNGELIWIPENLVHQHGVWFISFKEIVDDNGNIYPRGPLTKCNCVRYTPNQNICERSGSPAPYGGSCPRADLRGKCGGQSCGGEISK
jgi:hypothetical protein